MTHCLASLATVYIVCQIDPIRTISAGKVNLGAFRTYPKVLIGVINFFTMLVKITSL